MKKNREIVLLQEERKGRYRKSVLLCALQQKGILSGFRNKDMNKWFNVRGS